MNKFEQVSSDGHQMSLVEVGPGPEGVPCLEGDQATGLVRLRLLVSLYSHALLISVK